VPGTGEADVRLQVHGSATRVEAQDRRVEAREGGAPKDVVSPVAAGSNTGVMMGVYWSIAALLPGSARGPCPAFAATWPL